MEAWKSAYLSELDRYGHETPDRVLKSVYFGGGTPSLMEPSIVAAILEKLTDHWRLANDIEITLEANPSSVEAARFAGYRAAGVNRVSLGIQALSDADLRALGRLHDVKQALAALDIAKSTFDRVNFDLIYARQDQSLESWEAELRQALLFDPDHLSLYQLTIEDSTAFGARARHGKLLGLPEENLAADMFFLTQEQCNAAGLPAYEVSNHAKPGQESRHNMIYWQGGDYIGIGPGAHGRLTLNGQRYATTTPLSPNAWLRSVAEHRTGEGSREGLSAQDHAGEYLMMSLRTSEGSDLRRLAYLTGNGFKYSKIKSLEELALMKQVGDQITGTLSGRAVLNALIAELLPD